MDQNNQGQEAQPAVSQTNTQKLEAASDQVVIIEEKVTAPNGEISIRKYSKGKLLGKGGFAKCYEFTNLETQKVQAAKVIEKATLNKNRAKQKLLSEIKIHKSLRHENIVSFEHVFEDSECVYILLEVCSNQTLSELIKRRKRLTEFEVQCYTVQMVNALKHLRDNRIIHRDLKLGNLFLDEKMQIKLADFGLAAKLEFDGEKRKTICGTPNYIAPEVLDGKIGHSYEVDIWSLGVIIYTLIIGRPPFETPDVKTTYKKIKMLDYYFPENVQISDAARNLITKMINLDPSRRPTLEDILDHPFIDNGGSIPKTLPVSTLACAPSLAYLSQYANGKAVGGEVSTLTVSRNSSNVGTIKLNDQGTNNFNSSTNPNNQAMAMTSNDLKLATTKQSNPMEIEAEAGKVVKSEYGKLRNEAYVRTWVDYSSKYGLGYVLANGSTGVYFNDSTKIVFEPNKTYFEYIEKRKSDRVEEVNKYTLESYPKELHKKVALLQHFQKYLENGRKPEHVELDEESKKNGLVFVKKWLKTKHAVMFRLNNKVVQVNFTDKTEIILSSDTKIVIYQDKQGKRSEYPLASAMESTNVEMAKRLKYTKDILTTMLNGGGNQAKDSLQADQETQKIEFQTAS